MSARESSPISGCLLAVPFTRRISSPDLEAVLGLSDRFISPKHASRLMLSHNVAIFDWDGTLSDQMEPVYAHMMELWRLLGKKHPFPYSSLSSFTNAIHRLGHQGAIDTIFTPEEQLEGTRTHREELRALHRAHLPHLFPDAISMLSTLKTRLFEIFIVSNAEPARLEREIIASGVSPLINSVAYGDEEKRYRIKRICDLREGSDIYYFGDIAADVSECYLSNTERRAIVPISIERGFERTETLREMSFSFPDLIFSLPFVLSGDLWWQDKRTVVALDWRGTISDVIDEVYEQLSVAAGLAGITFFSCSEEMKREIDARGKDVVLDEMSAHLDPVFSSSRSTFEALCTEISTRQAPVFSDAEASIHALIERGLSVVILGLREERARIERWSESIRDRTRVRVVYEPEEPAEGSGRRARMPLRTHLLKDVFREHGGWYVGDTVEDVKMVHEAFPHDGRVVMVTVNRGLGGAGELMGLSHTYSTLARAVELILRGDLG
jgi:hypothetical protein